MSFIEIQNPDSVTAAVAEFDRIGRDAFLAKYGFTKARDYYLVIAGRRYDSKAILGAAHGYEFPALGPLSGRDFEGGARTVKPKLERLGFIVEGPESPPYEAGSNVFASPLLRIGVVYTRDELRRLLGTRDATINTGVFRPKGFNSILLFVTEAKTRDRTQYVDKLEGDVLRWQGQSMGRTDTMVIEHQQRGLELLVFYRSKKYQYSGAGFRYEGPFNYVTHKGELPANFFLRRTNVELEEAVSEAESAKAFDPNSVEDARKKTLAAIVRRQGQPAFRRALLRAYRNRCAMTGCDIVDVLEAAHIVPYQGPETNHVGNGLLLRADLHTLFDLGLVSIEPRSKSIVVALALRSSSYGALHGQRLNLPSGSADGPSEQALRQHFTKCGFEV
ncbi:HNH endonuclease [Ralstonia pseudosolanacearum]|uniref:HNH endonuclease n=1 Tax=Ralstonia pseudosolanacearum TaxID=1310165 RepID=UPI002676D541|nr:HNH endonuclease [Ralstonia pseudosolanacearum]MDO3562709.1 HNH endonuclease [Ralstonia pseudosolanacearum]MDO3572384.1 HNH endonuclease [Ralstonia pseudosolanacearum]